MHSSSCGTNNSESNSTLVAKLVANPKSANHFRTKVGSIPNYAMSFQPPCGYSVWDYIQSGTNQRVTRVRRHALMESAVFFSYIRHNMTLTHSDGGELI